MRQPFLSAATLATVLALAACATGPGAADAPPVDLSGAQVATRSVLEHGQSLAEEAVGLATRVVTDPGASAVAGSAFAQSVARLLAPASEPLSPLMHGRSLSARLAVIQVPFAALKASARTAGSTINDAYLAAVSGGLATYHEEHLTPGDHVRVNMPVNLRDSGDTSQGNRWVPARFPMPLDSGDPVRRIQRLGPILRQARTEPAMVLSDAVYRLLAVLPRQATTSISAGMMKGVDVAITNVPGPPIALYMAGAKVEAVVPFAPKCGAAVNVGLMSYDGTAYVGVTIDPRAVPDPEVLVEHLRRSFDEILAIAEPDAHALVGFHSG